EIIWLLGSFTAMIGDPTDKLAARKQLTAEDVKTNAATYKKQASKILKFGGENPVKMMMNDKWLAKMKFSDVVDLASHFTVQQMMERDMFEKRMQEHKPIYLHEFMYPLMQGYDSVVMDVDAELGGSDQTFNMLAGRTLLREMKQKEKFVIALSLLTNSEGKKMSKSEGGFVALTDAPEEMYGKLMSMDDTMIVPYFKLATDLGLDEITTIETELAAGKNPKKLKMKLAKTVVGMYHGRNAGARAEKHFESVFSDGALPETMPEFKLTAPIGVLDLLVSANLVPSKGEARRLIEQGGVKLGDAVITDIGKMIVPTDCPLVLQKGKRHFVKLVA
ncbi:MAG: tyrosine--tRNA ligase, partial [Candidatus Uhrbacteria bacterium]|nr:tyrosine--tRNA ligase [Candidatus Uhrbacteria bacterium]